MERDPRTNLLIQVVDRCKIDANLAFEHLDAGDYVDIPHFAEDAFSNRWRRHDCRHYHGAPPILILTGPGDLNSYRVYLWKKQRQELCDVCRCTVTVQFIYYQALAVLSS